MNYFPSSIETGGELHINFTFLQLYEEYMLVKANGSFVLFSWLQTFAYT